MKEQGECGKPGSDKSPTHWTTQSMIGIGSERTEMGDNRKSRSRRGISSEIDQMSKIFNLGSNKAQKEHENSTYIKRKCL